MISSFLLVFALFSPNLAYADSKTVQELSIEDDFVSELPKKFMDNIKNTISKSGDNIKNASYKILEALAICSVVILGMKLVFQQDNFQSFTAEVIKLIMFTGILFGILQYGFLNIVNIIESIALIPFTSADGTTTTQLAKTTYNPMNGGSVTTDLSVVDAVWGQIGYFLDIIATKVAASEWADKFIYTTLGILILFSLFAVFANLIIVTTKMYFVMCAGMIAVALGGLSLQNHYALNYVKAGLSLALQLMTISFLIVVMNNFIEQNIIVNEGLNNFTAHFANTLILGMFMLLFAFCATSIPNAVGALIDSSMNSNALQVLASAAAMTTAAKSGAVGTVTQPAKVANAVAKTKLGQKLSHKAGELTGKGLNKARNIFSRGGSNNPPPPSANNNNSSQSNSSQTSQSNSSESSASGSTSGGSSGGSSN